MATVLTNDLRLTTLEDPFAAHARHEGKRSGWGKASVGKAQVDVHLWNQLMDPIPVEQIAQRHTVAFRDTLNRVTVH